MNNYDIQRAYTDGYSYALTKIAEQEFQSLQEYANNNNGGKWGGRVGKAIGGAVGGLAGATTGFTAGLTAGAFTSMRDKSSPAAKAMAVPTSLLAGYTGAQVGSKQGYEAGSTLGSQVGADWGNRMQKGYESIASKFNTIKQGISPAQAQQNNTEPEYTRK